jgi:hypothetical protein
LAQRFAILIPIYTFVTVPAKKNPSSIAAFPSGQRLCGSKTIVLLSSRSWLLPISAYAASSLFAEFS